MDSIAMTREQEPLTEQLVDSNPLAMVPWQAHGPALHSTGPSKCLKVPRLLKQRPKCKLLGDLVDSSPKFLREGSLLYSITNEHDWEFERDNEIWMLEQKEDDILAALRLSYERLPSYLKRCFAYCSIFPKDYEMDDIELVYLWMANGLVQSSNENQELEDIGLRYFKELCSRCFFQDFSEYGGNVKCKMHDLIHDLALSLTQNECSMVRTSTQQILKSVLHISFPYPESLPNDLPESLQNRDCVRTICSINERSEGISSEVFIKKCVSRFKYIRALDLTSSGFEVLSTSIGDLKHLKYLSLVGNYLIRRLPNSICKLQSLQVLLLARRWSLEELPKDIKYMINLRFLWIATNQKYLPMGGIGCLKSLRFLFIDGCDNLEYLFEDMQGLKMLQRLIVRCCRSLKSLPQSIEFLTALETLYIDECEP
ncbi:putative disease resistance protein RGA4 [Hevea brasiliensis]|uniref:putative disease resistance protein RGA4 n=1 Tax=Hevea brasiliensis TaxID=3981 RepID=UPI0025D138D3|nr:putative disease resistance protein RGA4 [Hevea brasiliensis]